MIAVDPSHPLPIWKQIEDGLRRLIASRTLQPGDAVPSVRELARRLRVNPLTVQKATRGLVDEGLLEVRRGQGTFVSATLPSPLPGARSDEMERAATRFASLARTLGLDEDAAVAALRRGFQSLDSEIASPNPRDDESGFPPEDA